MRLLKYFAVIFTLITVVVGPAAASGSISEIQIPVQEFYLDNGMQFLIVERHATPQVACRLAIRAGFCP